MSPEYISFLQRFEKHLTQWFENLPSVPTDLYQPQQYILQLGGKRVRPLMVLVACDLFQKDVEKSFAPALAVELFHNFSLLHDDIMDAAPLRRGKETVHKKWNTNVAILSGDAMLVKAYEVLSAIDSSLLSELLPLFNATALKVCEGQQEDMNFEKNIAVSRERYMNMIKNKTAVLLGCALQMGGICAGANKKAQENLYSFGIEMGIIFQLMDDVLDAYGNEKVGKQKGGDILAGKKTILFIEAMENGDTEQKKQIENVYRLPSNEGERKINSALKIFDAMQIRQKIEKECEERTNRAESFLRNTGASKEKIDALMGFFVDLLRREN
jgi:geranylgeranyl diphosphate synthase type II